MERKNKEQKTAQILYITIIMVLLIMALAVGLVTATNRRNPPKITNTQKASETTRVPEKDHTSPSVTTLPIITAPTETSAPETAPPAPVINTDKPSDSLPEFMLPTVGAVSKTFSIDTLVYSNTMEDYRTHNGIDVSAAIGESVVASADGIVTEIYEHPMMGYTVVIAHGGDSETVYQNLSEEILTSVGETVKAGQVIGAVGESAIIEIADEPHLHFEMLVSGQRVNPLDFISEATMTVVYEDE